MRVRLVGSVLRKPELQHKLDRAKLFGRLCSVFEVLQASERSHWLQTRAAQLISAQS